MWTHTDTCGDTLPARTPAIGGSDFAFPNHYRGANYFGGLFFVLPKLGGGNFGTAP